MNTTTTADRELTPEETDKLAFLRAIVGDNTEANAQVDCTEDTWRNLPAPGPCPPWCSRPAGHPWVDDDPRAKADSCRYHSADFGPTDISFHVSQLEAADRDGTTTLHTPDVLTPLDSTRITDPTVLVQVAHAALDAANLLREIHESQLTTWSAR